MREACFRKKVLLLLPDISMQSHFRPFKTFLGESMKRATLVFLLFSWDVKNIQKCFGK